MHPDLDRDPALAARLQKLPEQSAPYGFAEFQRRRGARRPAFPRSPAVPAFLAGVAAAVLAVAVLGLLWLHRPGAPDPRTARQAGQPPIPRGAERSAFPSPPPEVLERWLARLPPDSGVVRVGSSAAMAGLEDRIAQIDDEISAERASRAHPARLQAIEAQRGLLLRSLVQVAYAESLAQNREASAGQAPLSNPLSAKE